MSIREMYRRELYYADLSGKVGSEQNGHRPVIVLQNNTGNKYSPTVIVAPITSKVYEKAKIPTHISISAGNGIKQESIILLEQIMVLDKSCLKEYIGILPSNAMAKVDEGIAIALGLGSTINGLTKKQAILYAQLGLNNLLHSANDKTPEDLKICMEGVFQLYPTIEKAEEMGKKLGYIKK